MAIDNSNVIDFIGVSKDGTEVTLAISDHLDWEIVDDHLEILQSKLNSYINFIESGEIYETYKNAINKKIVIEVIGKHDLSPQAIDFYDEANIILFGLKVKLRFTKAAE